MELKKILDDIINETTWYNTWLKSLMTLIVVGVIMIIDMLRMVICICCIPIIILTIMIDLPITIITLGLYKFKITDWFCNLIFNKLNL